MFHLPKQRVIGEEAEASDSVAPASPAQASAQASPAALEGVQVPSESTVSIPSHTEQLDLHSSDSIQEHVSPLAQISH
jgi:hypothetical protein